MPAPRRLASLLVAAIALAGSAWLAAQWRDEARLADAREALVEGRPKDALADATAVSGSSIDARAARIAAAAALGLGDLEAAAGHISRAVDASPNDWELRYDRAVVLRRLGRLEEAEDEMSRVLALNPQVPLPAGFRGPDAR